MCNDQPDRVLFDLMDSYGHAARFHGIYASTVCPMTADGAIAYRDLESHIGEVAGCGGLKGLLINGHAGENAMLEREEAREVVATARRVAPRSLIVAGVNAESSRNAVLLAEDAAAAGADAILVFAPFSWIVGVDARTVVNHHRAIHDATDLPLMLFQGSVNSGKLWFPPETLAALVHLPRVVGIKEGSWETSAYEISRRVVRETRPGVAVMASGDEHLLSSFVLGSEGSLVSLAAVVPQLIVALDLAVRAGDMAAARACHDRIYPLARTVYGTGPAGLVSARLKACLEILGRIDSAYCRPPTAALPAEEIAALTNALEAAGELTKIGSARPVPAAVGAAP